MLVENPYMHQELLSGQSVSIDGARSYTYTEACHSQELTKWFYYSPHHLEKFGGVSAAPMPNVYKPP